MTDASDSDDDLKKNTKPAQESELPGENVGVINEAPSLDEQKRTLFQQCPENSDKPNLDVHVKDILYSRRQPVESEDSDSSASPRSEPTENEEFSKVSLRDKTLEPRTQSLGHVLPCTFILTSNGDDLSNIHTQDITSTWPSFCICNKSSWDSIVEQPHVKAVHPPVTLGERLLNHGIQRIHLQYVSILLVCPTCVM